MADAAMLPLISHLRLWGNAATDDVFNGVTYWTDDQLQDILYNRGMPSHATITPRLRGSKTAYVIDAGRNHWFSTDFTLYSAVGNVLSATYTFNPAKAELTFDAAQTGEALYIEGFAVNMNDALADLWDIKASQRQHYVNFRGGHNVMNLREEYDHCIAKRDYYRNRTGRRFKK